jgi:hypothetical protein
MTILDFFACWLALGCFFIIPAGRFCTTNVYDE